MMKEKEMVFSKNATAFSESPENIAGVFFDGETAVCMRNIQGHPKSFSYHFEYGESEELFFSPSLLESQCAEGVTYGERFRKLILRMLEDLRKAQPKKNQLIAFLIPERGSWKHYLPQFCDYLENVFRSFDKSWSFVLVPMRSVAEQALSNSTSLFISIEREWTYYCQLRRDKSVAETSAHLGVSKTANPKHPVKVRMNDYLHNSTGIWTELNAADPAEAYDRIISSLYQNSVFDKTDSVMVSCPEVFQKAFSAIMTRTGCKVTWIEDLPLLAASAAKKRICPQSARKMPVPDKRDDNHPKQQKKKEKKNDWSDPFSR